MKVTQNRVVNVKPNEEKCMEALKYYFKHYFNLKFSQLPILLTMLGIGLPVQVEGFGLSEDYIALKFSNNSYIKFYVTRDVDPYPHIECEKEGFMIYQENRLVKRLYSICEMG